MSTASSSPPKAKQRRDPKSAETRTEGEGAAPAEKRSKEPPMAIKVPDRRNVETMDFKRSLPGGAKRSSKNGSGKAGGKDSNKEQADAKKKKKAKKRKTKRSLAERVLIWMGYSTGRVVLTDPKAVEAANALRLRPSHLRKLKAKFDSIDIDGSGNIDADEFFEAIGERRTPFTDKLFALIDLDGNGTIEFDEFVRVLATYCLFTKEEVLRFCFECFDVDGSGSIDEREFIELCKTVNNAAPTFPNNFKRALEEFDVNQDGLIDYVEFLELDRRYPLVLFPAFRLQDYMQKNTLGESEWLDIVEGYTKRRRIEAYKDSHGGRVPPDPPVTAILKMAFPFMYREKEYIKLGKAN